MPTITLMEVPEYVRDKAISKSVIEVIETEDIDGNKWEEYEMYYDDFLKTMKPYDVRTRSGSTGGIFYMYWFDGKKSHQRSTRKTNYQIACKVAKEMWIEIKGGLYGK